jgi:hypothetical protein
MPEITIEICIPAITYAICDELAEIRRYDSTEQYIAKLVMMAAFMNNRIISGEEIEDYSAFVV